MRYIKNLVATGFAFVVAIAASAQSPRQLDYGVNFGQNGKVISARDDGYVFVAGTFEGTQDFGTFTLTSNGNADIYVLQIDATGTIVNAISFGSVDASEEVMDIHVDNADGNIHIVGSFGGIVDFDPGPSDVSVDAGILIYGYILTLDLDLGFERVGTIASDGWAYVNAVATDADGSVYLTGYFENSADLDPTSTGEEIVDAPGQSAFFIKTNVAGALQWAKAIGNDVQVLGTGVTVDFAGNPVFTGTYLTSVDVNPDAGTETLTAVGNSDVFILKLASATGAFTWGKSIGGDGGNNFTDAIGSDGQNNVYITGVFYGTGDFDPGAGQKILTTHGGDADIFITKFNQAGALVWARNFGSISYESANAISVSGSDIYLTGEFYDAIDFGTGSSRILEPFESGDIYFLNLDTSGNLKWVERLGGTNYDVGHDVVTDASGNTYTMGRFDSYDADLNPACGTLNLNPDDGYSYILRIGTSAGECVAITQQPQGVDVCPGTQVVLTVESTGTGVSYQWMMMDSDGGYFELVDAAGMFSGATTKTLTITTNASYQGEGTYVVVLTKAPDQQVTSDAAHVTVGPHTPYIVNPDIVNCGAGSGTITTIGSGSPGQYRWYTVETGGSPIAGATNAVYTTPVLSVTTSYYVSINNGLCESPRLKVTVHITACEPAPGFKWAKTFGGSGQDDGIIIPLKDGNFLVAGSFIRSADLDAGPGEHILTAADNFQDAYLMKMTPEAEILWVKQFTGNTSTPYPSFLKEDPNGNIYLTGTITGNSTDFDAGAGTLNLSGTNGANNFPDAFIVKFDKDGNTLWGKKMGNTPYFDGITGLEVDDNAAYITGYFWNTFTFDGNTLTRYGTGGSDIFISKISSAGNVIWLKQIGNTYADGNLQTETSSSLFLKGSDLYMTATIDFMATDVDPGPGVHEVTPTGSGNACVVRYNTDGEFQSVFQYTGTDGGTNVGDMFVDNNNIYLSGNFVRTVDFDPGAGTFNITSTGGFSGSPASNAFITKHTLDGTLVWAKALHVDFLNDSYGGDMTVASNGDLIISGMYQGSVDFDPGPLEYILHGSSLFLNTYVVKLNASGEFNWAISLQRIQNVSSSAGGGPHFIDAAGDIYVTGSLRGSVDFDPLDCKAELLSHPNEPLTVPATYSNDFYLWKLSFNAANICFDVMPADRNICAGGEVSFTAIAVGAPGITYQWQRSDTEAGTYEGLTEGSDYSGTKTSELKINTANGFGSGFYRSIASAPNAADKTSTVAELAFLGTAPNAPTTIGAATCDASGDFTLVASGSPTGDYQWYDVPTGGSSPYSLTGDSFETGVITSSKTLYVSAIDGVCESTRTPVVATVNAGDTPPTAAGALRCDPGPVTLSVIGAADGDYRWYTSAVSAPISGQINGTFTTPSLNTTTSYYVSIALDDCESPKTEVVATIGSLTAPVVSNAAACLNASANITATVSDGEARWYAAASGGSPIYVGNTYTTPVLLANAIYYVSNFVDDCESERIAVNVTVSDCDNNQPPVITAPTNAATNVGGILTLDLGPFLSDPDNNIDIATLKIITQPMSGAVATIVDGQLVVDYTGNIFVGEDELTIEVCDIAGSCVQQVIHIIVSSDIIVYNAVSPNGDGKNDVFFIAFIDAFEATRNNQVKIYNRWGDLVYDVSNYNNTTNVFAGKNANGNDLPSGTYFYKIEFQDGRKSETGYLSLKR